MSDPQALLPPSAKPSLKVIEAVMAERTIGIEAPIATLWNPETCPANILPWLAWALSVDNWDANWSEGTKRNAIAASVAIHRRKGTVRAVKDALAAAGYGDAELIERHGWERHDGTNLRDGSINRSVPDHWAEYRVRLARPITVDQAAQVRAILASAAPARCRLKALEFTQALHLHNNTITRDGSYTRGIA